MEATPEAKAALTSCAVVRVASTCGKNVPWLWTQRDSLKAAEEVIRTSMNDAIGDVYEVWPMKCAGPALARYEVKEIVEDRPAAKVTVTKTVKTDDGGTNA